MFQNRITLIGFLGQDAEIRRTKNAGTQYVVLSLATKRSWKDRESGERQSETTWHRCVVWGRLGDFAASLTKGAHLQVEGDLRKRDYSDYAGGKESAGATKTVVEVRVTAIAKLDRPTRAAESDPEPAEVPQ